MRQHETRVEFAVDVDQPLHMRFGEAQRIIAGIEELDLGAECGRGALGLVAAAGLDLFQRHARLLPGELGFAAFAERQAHDLDAVAFPGMQRDGAAGTPDEIAGVGRYNKSGLRHRIPFRIANSLGDRTYVDLTSNAKFDAPRESQSCCRDRP
jgi:hypothetical protein